MFALPQIFPVPVLNVSVAGGIELSWLATYVAWALLAAFLVSALGILREVRRVPTCHVQCRGDESTPRTRQRSLCPLTRTRTRGQLEAAAHLS
jgi:hypothetical protein